MTVLIKGMEMPNRCFECIFLTTVPNFFCLAGKRDLCAEHGINISRPDWCPLIEVQYPHGRLIDADAFAANLKDISVRQGYKNTLIDEHLTVDDVFDSIIDELTGKAIYGFEYNPTIIEAEGSENENRKQHFTQT